MTVGVIRFGGSNCDRDTVAALQHLGIDAEIVWYADGLPDDLAGIVLPGGFSYGDYLRAGAMAAQTPIMDEIAAAAADGVPVLGICNGAQIGCESGLTPGAFTVNQHARFRCDHVHVRIETTDTPWTTGHDEGDVIALPIAHGEGRYEASDAVVEELEREDRVLCRYCDEDGDIAPGSNLNGSKDAIAGVVSADRNVAVIMPHPERATLPYTGGTGGQRLLAGFGQA